MKKLFALIFMVLSCSLFAQNIDNEYNKMECTSVTVGKKASKDGAVMTSHTDDSGRSRTNMTIEPAKDYGEGEMQTIYKREACPKETPGMPQYCNVRVGEIPQATHTYQFLNTAYPCMNEKQLAIGESTFGGRTELRSSAGMI